VNIPDPVIWAMNRQNEDYRSPAIPSLTKILLEDVMGTYWPYTPSIQLLYGLRTALDLIFEEGLDNVIKRHNRLGTATRYGGVSLHAHQVLDSRSWIGLIHCINMKCRFAVEAWGLKNCCQKEECFSDTVTAVVVPPYIDSAEIVKDALKRYNLSLGLGLNKVAGKVFRIGHLGNLNEVRSILSCALQFATLANN
jgi:alanine-glyoxylate transaminase/serine-glyoxylate transaminase/serine-pyruvate transaminase